MAGEVANIAQIAVKISTDIFKWFHWDVVPVMDENFPCHKVSSHKPEPKPGKGAGKKIVAPADKTYTHPVDVVFKYFDPYLNKKILLNTDLKSYAKSSIKGTAVKDAVESLAKTIDCARSSGSWKGKYVIEQGPYEIRGMLFIYNHDNAYHNDFLELFKGIETGRLGIQEGQVLHILDALRIRYLCAVIADMKHLHALKEFPIDDYSFFYPELYLHRSHGDPEKLPATVELLCSPYMIVRHGPYVSPGVPDGSDSDGYVIYYNQSGSTEHEFRYLLDSLSRFQILRGKCSIKIRVAHHAPDSNIKINFQTAKNIYLTAWGTDQYKKAELDRIEFESISLLVPNYIPGHLAWRHQ